MNVKRTLSLFQKAAKQRGDRIIEAHLCDCDECAAKPREERTVMSIEVDHKSGDQRYLAEHFTLEGFLHQLKQVEIDKNKEESDGIQRERSGADHEQGRSECRDWRYYKKRAIRRNKRPVKKTD